METEAAAAGGNRPRPILLIVLGIAIVALIAVKLMPSGSARPGRPTSNQTRTAAPTTGSHQVNPQDLDVRIESLKSARAEPGGADRNPFRFPPKAPPPPPPTPPNITGRGPEGFVRPPPAPSTGEMPPPPIPLKYFGIIEGQGRKLAAFSDCKFTYRGEEGDIIEGRYRLVKIGVESVVMEYVDGRGRTTIRLSGQGDCAGR